MKCRNMIEKNMFSSNTKHTTHTVFCSAASTHRKYVTEIIYLKYNFKIINQHIKTHNSGVPKVRKKKRNPKTQKVLITRIVSS